MSSRVPVHPDSSAKYPWERLLLVSIATVVTALIEAAPLFKLDSKQRETMKRNSTIWVWHLVKHLDEQLQKLPGPFGAEYAAGVYASTHAAEHRSFLLSEEIIYSLAEYLGLFRQQTEVLELCI